MKSIINFLFAIAVPILVGLLSSFITRGNMNVFDEVAKPMLTPPAVVFPVAWTILYVLMGVASFLAVRKCKDAMQISMVLVPYIIQLVLNFLWSVLFFNGQWYGWSFICLVVMWIAILCTMVAFKNVSYLAFCLMIPLLVWVTFAGYLNAGIFLLER